MADLLTDFFPAVFPFPRPDIAALGCPNEEEEKGRASSTLQLSVRAGLAEFDEAKVRVRKQAAFVDVHFTNGLLKL